MSEPVNGGKRPWGTITGIGGIATAAVSLIVTNLNDAKREAAVALEVVAQHGAELQDVRKDLLAIRAQMSLGGRFTRADGDRVELRLDRLTEWLERHERHQRRAPEKD